ncbi:hypothetical protein WEH80_22440 [Actinomycetes bacterium KLBMP 9759]
MSANLIEFLRSLLWNDDLRQDFNNDPQGTLEANGFDHLSNQDIVDALTLINEDNHEASFDRDYETGGNHIGGGNVTLPAPEPHQSPAEYITQVVNNNYVDDRDTIVDNSINQNIDNRGGEFNQDIDIDSNVVSGDGAVGAGGDLNGDVITGDGNVQGNGNQVANGDGATTSFGSGDAVSTEIGGNVNVGDGGSFASGGDSTVDNTDNSMSNVGNDYSDNSMSNVGNDYSETSYQDAFNNETDNSINDSGNEHTSIDVDDSGNTSHDYTDNSDTFVDA